MRNRVHGSGTMPGAPEEERDGTSLNLTAHINSRERVSFRRYKSGTASKGVPPDVRSRLSPILMARSNETITDHPAPHRSARGITLQFPPEEEEELGRRVMAALSS